MIIPRQSIIHRHHQEFCVGAIGNWIIVKAYFKIDWHIFISCKLYIIFLIKI